MPQSTAGFQPRWPGACENYARKFVANNHWRVRAILEPEDALQECAVVFCRCAKLYAGRIDNPAWFMAVFKTALLHYFTSLARINQRQLRVRAAIAEQARLTPAYVPASGPLAAAMAEASAELRQVLEAVVRAPQELLELLLPKPGKRSPAAEAAISRSWCRLVRTGTVRDDLIGELKDLLNGAT
jgi:DNA-directed RNA polymerase specialized sigma24 family protein